MTYKRQLKQDFKTTKAIYITKKKIGMKLTTLRNYKDHLSYFIKIIFWLVKMMFN